MILSPSFKERKTYPQWVECATAELQIQNCEEDIRPAKPFIRADKIASLKSYGFADEKIIQTMVSDSIQNDIKLQCKRRIKAPEILRKMVGSKLIANADAKQIWSTLEERFQDITSTSLLEVIRKAYLNRMSDFLDVNE